MPFYVTKIYVHMTFLCVHLIPVHMHVEVFQPFHMRLYETTFAIISAVMKQSLTFYLCACRTACMVMVTLLLVSRDEELCSVFTMYRLNYVQSLIYLFSFHLFFSPGGVMMIHYLSQATDSSTFLGIHRYSQANY